MWCLKCALSHIYKHDVRGACSNAWRSISTEHQSLQKAWNGPPMRIASCFSSLLLPLFSVGLALCPCLIILVQFSNFEILGLSWLNSCGILDPFAEAKLWLLESVYITKLFVNKIRVLILKRVPISWIEKVVCTVVVCIYHATRLIVLRTTCSAILLCITKKSK